MGLEAISDAVDVTQWIFLAAAIIGAILVVDIICVGMDIVLDMILPGALRRRKNLDRMYKDYGKDGF